VDALLREHAASDARAAASDAENLRGVYRLPFVYVFGRSFFTISYFGANVYPENVTVGLEQPHVRDWVTGKFVLEVLENPDRDVYLSVTVEQAPNAQLSEAQRQAIAVSIRGQLLRLNSEFAHYVPVERQLPVITLKHHGDPDYFPVGVKHRYTRGPARQP
jgi:phenylacetate-CoA ligase